MTVLSPVIDSTSNLDFTVQVDDVDLPVTFQVISIETWVAVNKIPKARLVLYDGNAAAHDFEISSQKTFLPGNTVAISAGYNLGPKATIFRGLIVKQAIEIDEHNGSRLIVDVCDRA